MVQDIRNKIPFQKPYLAPFSIYRVFSPFRFIQAVREVTGGKIFSFPQKRLDQLNLVTGLNYLQFGLDFFLSLPISIHYQSKSTKKNISEGKYCC